MAESDPRHLVLSIDANAAALAAGLSRATRRRVDNAVFVLASAEQLPHELCGVADELRVQFPWGSLLRLVLTGEADFVSGLASLLVPRGRLAICLSVMPRDRVAAASSLEEPGVRQVLARLQSGGQFAGGRVTSVTPEIAKHMHSSWAKRLRVGTARPAWLIETTRGGPA